MSPITVLLFLVSMQTYTVSFAYDLTIGGNSIFGNGEVLIDNNDISFLESTSYIIPSNSTAFSSLPLHQNRLSSQFNIKSTVKTNDGFDICLKPKTLTSGSKVITKKCFSGSIIQKWTIDEYGRIHTAGDENLCLTKASKNNLNLFSCGTEGNKNNKFVLNAFENTINLNNNGLKVVGVKKDAPVFNKPIIIPKRNRSSNMQQWTMVPDTLFITTEDIPSEFYIESAFTSTCLEASSLTDGTRLRLKSCQLGNNNQMWSVDVRGIINSAADTSKCIVRNAKKLEIGSCAETNNNMFMYDATDFSIVLKTKANTAVTFKNGNVIMARKQPSNMKQVWMLTEFDNVIKFIANPCTDAFPDGKCEVCTGDCDSDSDCEDGLRCVMRRNNGGNEIVPGCQWGNDDLKYDDDDYCFLPTSQPGVINYVGECGSDYKCGLCEGDCDNDSDCEDDLVCLQRDGFAAVDECTGAGGERDVFGKDVCVSKATAVQYVGNPCTDAFPDGKCEVCTGDCDSDSDCADGLRCASRRESNGLEIVPGCRWTNETLRYKDDDYCFLPISQPGVINYVGECGSEYKCGLCEGDCDNDSDCEGDLVCLERDGFAAVDGCTGAGGNRDIFGKDVCVPAVPSGPFLDSLEVRDEPCSTSNPCDKCQGECINDGSCSGDLVCFMRTGLEPVPGCVTGGTGDISDVNYCYDQPTNGDPTYIPGDLTKREAGLVLSTGLTAKIIAETGQRVRYTGPNGGQSSSTFHVDPDAAAVFEVTSGQNAGGWIYVSNAEERVGGGVGAITFNADGEVINYEMILTNTKQNCGGGKTYWGTWVTCEENGSEGQVWEVHPTLGASAQRNIPTVLGGDGGNYESFAYDARDRLNPTFYVTNDSSRGGLVQFTPDPTVVANAESSGDYSQVLYSMGTLKWLLLSPENGNRNDSSGTFQWTSSRRDGDNNSNLFYQYSEGIDVRDGFLYFVTKTSKSLYILDLDNSTYERSSTVSGAFDGQPDQVKRILSEDPSSDMLYFCEEASRDNGIHARDSEGNFYTIIDSDTVSSETSGLAFSPDKRHMYVSYQDDGLIYDITREDGYPFGAHRLDIKYHAS